MLHQEVVERIRRLLAKGVSRRRVARIVGVSRKTIRDIAKGRRPDYAATGGVPDENQDQRAQRCSGCGHLVFITPCVICRAGAALADVLRARRLRPSPDPSDPLRIELRGRAQKRYEEIHARKVQEHLQPLRPTEPVTPRERRQ